MARRPNRSEASLAQRREYFKRWRAEHPDYNREYRREHHAEELERRRAWREHNRDLIREQRLRYFARHPRPERADPAPIVRFQGHEYYDTARFICGIEPYWDASLFGWEECMGNVALALVEGRDPNEAAAASWAYERTWKYRVGPLFPNVDVRADTGEVVFVKRHEEMR